MNRLLKSTSCIFPQANKTWKKALCVTAGVVGVSTIAFTASYCASIAAFKSIEYFDKKDFDTDVKTENNWSEEHLLKILKVYRFVAVPVTILCAYGTVVELHSFYKFLQKEVECCAVVRRSFILPLGIISTLIVFGSFVCATMIISEEEKLKQ